MEFCSPFISWSLHLLKFYVKEPQQNITGRTNDRDKSQFVLNIDKWETEERGNV